MQPDRLEHDSFDSQTAAAADESRLSPRAKLLVALALLIVIALPPPGWWVISPYLPISIVHLAIAAVLFVGGVLVPINLGYAGRRMAMFFLPLSLVALSIPLARGAAGWPIMANVLAKGLLSFSVVLILVHTTGFDRLLRAMRQLGAPKLLIAVLAAMYRYVFVLLEELERMRRAQFARTFDCPRRLSPITLRNGTRLIAMLFLRCHQRAERVHAAMISRGFDGEMPSSDK